MSRPRSRPGGSPPPTRAANPEPLITDVPGLRVGHATDAAALTGVSVVLCDRPAVCGVELRGGANDVVGLDFLDPRHLVPTVDGVVLGGGSRFGEEAVYGVLRWLDPLIRAAWRWTNLGITVDLRVRGRRTGRSRAVLLGLIEVAGRWYVGHPNGEAEWTRNVAVAGEAVVAWPSGVAHPVRAERLPDGDERDAVILATAHQQPFPGNLLYRAARPHILAVGAYFRLEPTEQGWADAPRPR